MEQEQGKQHSRFSLDMDLDYRHVDVVDGIRGLTVLMVLWFHFWQQTWFMPNYPTPWLSFLGITNLTPSHIRWVGYIFVDIALPASTPATSWRCWCPSASRSIGTTTLRSPTPCGTLSLT